jgi:hypothetical protein
MLKRTLVAGLLAAATATPVLAHGGYYDDGYVDARVIRVEPVVSFSYSNWGGHDAFRILYEWGGHHYWTSGPYHPGRWVRVRTPRVTHYYTVPQYRHERHNVYRHDWRGDWRHEWRDGPRHDRHGDHDRRDGGRGR